MSNAKTLLIVGGAAVGIVGLLFYAKKKLEQVIADSVVDCIIRT